MTYESSHVVYINPVLGRGGLLQPFDIKAIYWIFSTLEDALAEARKARLVGLYGLPNHCYEAAE